MAGVCNSNAILSGLIDYYCLVCEDLFQNIEDVHQHVDTPHHNKILQQTCYVKEYTDHGIRKLRKGYFCEYCNEAFTTSSKMRSHVESKTHVYRRNNKQFSSSRSVLNLSWSENRVLTSHLLIDEKPWNGILDDDTCLVCDEEIDSLEDHKKIWSHVLKLAQTKILVGNDELSRKINDSLYQCLICNTMCSANDYDKHNTTELHTKNYTKATESTVDTGDIDETSSKKGTNAKTGEKQAVVNQKLSKEKQNNQKQSFDDGGDVAKSFAKVNDMTYDEGVNTAICNICKVKMPFYLKDMKEHIHGNQHKRNSKADKASNEKKLGDKTEKFEASGNVKRVVKDVKKPYKTVPFEEFCTEADMSLVKNRLNGDVELVIHEKILIRLLSFAMITSEDNDRIKCHVCNKTFENFLESQIHFDKFDLLHGANIMHVTALKRVPVIIDLEDKREFVREVRPGMFHCGYCNIVVPGWEDLNLHLNTMIHNRMKMEGAWKVEQIKMESGSHEKIHYSRLFTLAKDY